MIEHCYHGSRVADDLLARLHESQAGPERHKCCICAYVRGLSDGQQRTNLENAPVRKCRQGSQAPRELLKVLPESQGGTGRHKCAACAYQLGYQHGLVNAAIDNRFNGNSDKDSKRVIRKVIERSWKDIFRQATEIRDVQRKAFVVTSGRTPEEAADEARTAKEIGDLGEEIVVHTEKERLTRDGRPDLAALVEHVSRTRGDGLGYDVKSFERTGKDRCIEVKTTTGGMASPLNITRNELEYSRTNKSTYYLYRLFNLDFEKSTAELVTFHGEIETHFNLDCAIFRATPRE